MLWDWSRISGPVVVTGNPGGRLLLEQNGPRQGLSVGTNGSGQLLHGNDPDRLDWGVEVVEGGLLESGFDSKTRKETNV
jgi:hypothetical protein